MAHGGWNPGPGAPAPQQPGAPAPQHPGAPAPQHPGAGYQQAPAPGPTAGLSIPTGAQTKGFFAGLFDFSFETFVALKVIKVLYALFLILLALGILGGLGGAIVSILQGEFLAGLVMLVLLPFAALIYLVLGRVYFELIIVAFKIAEDADEIARNTRR